MQVGKLVLLEPLVCLVQWDPLGPEEGQDSMELPDTLDLWEIQVLEDLLDH